MRTILPPWSALFRRWDPDINEAHSYTVNDSRFEIVGDQLRLKQGVFLDFEADPSIVVTVTVTDIGGLSFAKNFTISVNDLTTGINWVGTSGRDNQTGSNEDDVLEGLDESDDIFGGDGADRVLWRATAQICLKVCAGRGPSVW